MRRVTTILLRFDRVFRAESSGDLIPLHPSRRDRLSGLLQTCLSSLGPPSAPFPASPAHSQPTPPLNTLPSSMLSASTPHVCITRSSQYPICSAPRRHCRPLAQNKVCILLERFPSRSPFSQLLRRVPCQYVPLTRPFIFCLTSLSALVTCAWVYNVESEHAAHEDPLIEENNGTLPQPPPYPYLNRRVKPFPWGNNSLFFNPKVSFRASICSEILQHRAVQQGHGQGRRVNRTSSLSLLIKLVLCSDVTIWALFPGELINNQLNVFD